MQMIISTVIVVGLMMKTWNWVHEEKTVSYATHVNLQNELKKILEKKLILQNPSIKNIFIRELWTEPLPHEQKIKAFTSYTFDIFNDQEEKVVTQEVKAELLLEKNEVTDQDEIWILKSFKTPKEILFFEESLRINPQEK